MAEIQYASFQNGVWVDQANGTAGTAYPIGTARKPVSSFLDARAIADFRGFSKLYLIGNAVMGADSLFDTFEIVGQSANLTHLHILPEASVVSCEIRECYVTGTLDGGSILRECVIADLSYVNGVVHQCMLNPGVIMLGGGPMSAAFLLDCYSGVPSPWQPIVIDFNGDGPALSVRGHNGGLEFTNKTNDVPISADFNSGYVRVASSVSAGHIVIRGVGRIEDHHTGTAVVDSAYLLSPETIAGGIWAHSVALQLISNIGVLRDIEGGKWQLVNNQMIFYAEDNATEIARFDLFDAQGAATTANPSSRVRVP
jgi:hypothetical protein